MYIKIINGIPTPYSINRLRRDNPQVSFPKSISDALAAEYGALPFQATPAPAFNPMTQALTEATPTLTGGIWTQQWVVSALDPAVIAENQAVAAQAAADLAARQDAKAEPIIGYMLTHTAAEIRAKINADVTDLNSAKQMLGRFGVALAYLARNGLR